MHAICLVLLLLIYQVLIYFVHEIYLQYFTNHNTPFLHAAYLYADPHSQLRKYPTSVSALSFNCTGEKLAIASSYTFEEGEKEYDAMTCYAKLCYGNYLC